MGIMSSVAALLVRAREQGASFERTATIGRQSMAVPVADFTAFARRLGIEEPDYATFGADGYCEDFLRLFLGACSVTAFDASNYQHAGIVHDFNVPLPQEHYQAFDAVIDGGSIEHIFDIRQVLENYMNLVKVGGHVFICTNANNLCGHGFYQFSPEFFYRVFSEANGFRVRSLCLIETPFHLVEKSSRQRIFAAADPPSVGKRMVLVTDKVISVYVDAQRVALRPLFAEAPYQSDYRFEWNAHAVEEASAGDAEALPGASGRNRYEFTYLSAWNSFRRSLLQRRKNSLRNRRWFKPLDPLG